MIFFKIPTNKQPSEQQTWNQVDLSQSEQNPAITETNGDIVDSYFAFRGGIDGNNTITSAAWIYDFGNAFLIFSIIFTYY